MSFWADKIQEITPQRAPEPKAVAPGAWWQQGTEHGEVRTSNPPQYQSPQQTVPQQYQGEYRPEGADHIDSMSERCPRCGSKEYAEIIRDVSMGGRIDPREGPRTKRCFDCRYPGIDASGDVIKGRGQISSGTPSQLRKVKQSPTAARPLSTILDGAVNIDHLVS